MPPECLIGARYNLKADVYAFAMIVWEMLTGKVPFEFSRTMGHLIHDIVTEKKRPDIQGEWPAMVKDMLEKSFDSDMNKRPVSPSSIYQCMIDNFSKKRTSPCFHC